MARIVGRSLADGGLRPDSSGGHFGWRGCPDFRHALAGEAYASSVPGNSYCGNAGESPGRQRSRRHLPSPNISVHLLPAGHDRAGRHQNVGVRRSSRPRDRATPLDGDRRSPGHLAASPSIRQRVHGHDRGGGRKQWCDGFQGTSFRHRTPHPYRGNRNSRGDAGRHRISLQGVWRGRHASRPIGLSKCALAVACRHHRQGHLLRSEHWIDPGSLALSANTAFADFPRLARAIAENGFLPHGLAIRGRRLVYTQGVYALALLAGTLLVAFGGVTERLIPLYAVGAFMAFTLSQAGMVMHWRRVRGPGSSKSMFVNGLGALATGLTVIVVLIAKFTEGAWITLILIPGLILMMRLVKRHFDYVAGETDNGAPLNIRDLTPPIVVITIDRWSRITQKALRFAMTISPDVLALHVDHDQESDTLASQWAQLVEEPARRAGLAGPRLVILKSPYRFVIRPILDYALDLEKNNPRRQIAVLTPKLVEFRWYLNLLHNHRSAALKTLLLFQGDRRIMVINIPWYLTDQDARP